jgi:uncharacterized protein (DUF2252 family)
VARRGSEVLDAILAFNSGRNPQLVARKLQTMRASPFAFMRGSCHLFYARAPQSKLLQTAPPAWSCGDLHLENFGSYKGDNRLVYFDLNDFDEAALAPCTWDVVRLLASVCVAADTLGLARRQAHSLCDRLMQAYATEIQEAKPRWIERETASGMVKALLEGLSTRTRKALLDSRTVRSKGQRTIRLDGKHALAVTDQERARIEAFVHRFGKRQRNPGFFRLLDTARRVAGTGSLGIDRYVLLVEGKGSPDGNYLLDLKQALPSSLLSRLKSKQPKWKSEAQRVVWVQRLMQAVPMAFLTPVTMGRTSYVLRGLQPSEDRLALRSWKGDLARLEGVVSTMGQLVAWAQLRSSAREGSARVDELVQYWSKRGRPQKVVHLAQDCGAQVESDWRAYCLAYDQDAASHLSTILADAMPTT